jgi:hypothetical protein
MYSYLKVWLEANKALYNPEYLKDLLKQHVDMVEEINKDILDYIELYLPQARLSDMST